MTDFNLICKALSDFDAKICKDYKVYNPLPGINQSLDLTVLPKEISGSYRYHDNVVMILLSDVEKYVDKELFFEVGLYWGIGNLNSYRCGICSLEIHLGSSLCTSCVERRKVIINDRRATLVQKYLLLTDYTLRDLAAVICKFMVGALVHPALR